MNEETSPANAERKSSSKDITPLLRGWDYEPGTINVRKISGTDGAPKLQMRLDLGHHAFDRAVLDRRIEPPGERGALKLRRSPADIKRGG